MMLIKSTIYAPTLCLKEATVRKKTLAVEKLANKGVKEVWLKKLW